MYQVAECLRGGPCHACSSAVCTQDLLAQSTRRHAADKAEGQGALRPFLLSSSSSSSPATGVTSGAADGGCDVLGWEGPAAEGPAPEVLAAAGAAGAGAGFGGAAAAAACWNSRGQSWQQSRQLQLPAALAAGCHSQQRETSFSAARCPDCRGSLEAVTSCSSSVKRPASVQHDLAILDAEN